MNINVKEPSGIIFRWTEELTLKAADLWNDGKTASQIAPIFGVSRNAIVGLAHRKPKLFKKKGNAAKGNNKPHNVPAIKPNRNTGFFERPKRDGMTVTAKKKAVKREAEEDALIIEALPEPTSYDAERLVVAKELHELGRCECHWPLNQGGPFLFCSAETGGKTYCAPHASRAMPKREGI
ncbi:GcrA family cell cycle regulator [Rhizobium puerariae]|uniref:GcrA family cell cycle regulator n=1 Tax=Rhizobium puerariae TaxID=1585791 RepID=A0ABV6AN52_9HYPH